ncbi:hypothetical protein HDV04_005161 [Boothiomyces sp. JEL0838]|nr:hypothetical protein HDV04_005161 [Boothiomyces sp. JEL0838]
MYTKLYLLALASSATAAIPAGGCNAEPLQVISQGRENRFGLGGQQVALNPAIPIQRICQKVNPACSQICTDATNAAVATGVKGFQDSDPAKLAQMVKVANDFNAALGVAPQAPIGSGNQAGNQNSNQNNNQNNNSANNANSQFGTCGVPDIQFGPGFDGRNENSFIVKGAISHGSALNFKVIGQFVCGQLGSQCKAPQSTVDNCNKALAAVGGTNNGQQTVDQFLSILKGGASNSQQAPTPTQNNNAQSGTKTVTVTQTVCAPTSTNAFQGAQTVTVTQTVCAATATANPLAGNGNNGGNTGTVSNNNGGNTANVASGNNSGTQTTNNNASVIAQLKTIVQQMANLLSNA